MFLMGSEESDVKLAPASCAYPDEIILLWATLSVSESVLVGAGNYKEKQSGLLFLSY